MIIKIKKQVGLNVPKKAHSSDTGFDIICTSEPTIFGEKADFPLYSDYRNFGTLWKSVQFLEYKTNLFISPKDIDNALAYKRFCTFIYPRSSICNKNLIWANSVSVIDNSYRGELLIRMRYLIQPQDLITIQESRITRTYLTIDQQRIYHAGEKCGQLVVSELIDANFDLVDNLDQTTRAEKGFGSSGQ